MRVIKKINLVLLFALTLFVSLMSINVFASENSYSNFAATYKVLEVAEEYNLGYGVEYHKDLATTSVKESQYARGDAYGNEVKYAVQPGKEYSQQVNVLEIDPTKDVQLVPYAFLSGSVWSSSTLRSAALEYEIKNPGYRVVAGVNGDYFQISMAVKASTGVTIGQGQFYKAQNDHGGAHTIAIKNNGEGKQLFTTSNTQNAPVLSIYDNNGNIIKKIAINKVNSEPSENEIALYYTERPKAFEAGFNPGPEVENVWLVKDADYAVTTQIGSFYGIGNITENSVAKVVINEGDFAIKSNNPEITALLNTGVKIRAQYEFTDPSLEGIENFIGFPFTIIENNQVINHDSYRHPRTMIGQRENGEIILAVIDGRQENSKGFHGASSTEMAALMGYYGCVDAWNLDGGGSSTLIVRKQPGWDFEGYNEKANDNWHVTNSPSDKSERSDGNHLLVVAKVPETTIEYETIGVDYVTLNVVLLTEIEKYKDLYVNLDGEYYQVQDGKVTITGLKKNTDYTFYVSSKVGDDMYNLMASTTVTTSKPAPTTVSIKVDNYVKNGEKLILIRYTVDYNDAIRSIILVADKDYLSASELIMIEGTTEFYDALKNATIKIKYRDNALFDEKVIIFEEFEVTYSLGFIMNEIKYTTNESILGVFN